MKTCTLGVLTLLLSVLVTACSTGFVEDENTTVDKPYFLYVMSNGWHSSLIIRHERIDDGKIPETKDFDDSGFVEFGWGDAKYYPMEKPGFEETLSAAFVPTKAVIHMSAYNELPGERHSMVEVVRLAISEVAMKELVSFIHGSFDRAGMEKARMSDPGLFHDSRFYPAKGRFHILYTCNTWTAEALGAAGLDIDPGTSKTAGGLMHQVRSVVMGTKPVIHR